MPRRIVRNRAISCILAVVRGPIACIPRRQCWFCKSRNLRVAIHEHDIVFRLELVLKIRRAIVLPAHVAILDVDVDRTRRNLRRILIAIAVLRLDNIIIVSNRIRAKAESLIDGILPGDAAVRIALDIR